ncbi:MAG: hypothetical protein J07HB67_00172 [halophilic archaeon J07HB67]|jgi:hypothetical protein|nr:MAG: hypothetical protein J07HB67_00172 [halophilic archaeon J07HB67]
MRGTHDSGPAVIGTETHSPAQRRGSVAGTVATVIVAHLVLLAVLAPVVTLSGLLGVAVGVAATA